MGIAIGTLTVCVTMFLIGRHEAENDIRINLMISVVVGFTTLILSLLIGLFALPIGFALFTWAVYKFCYLGWGKAAIVSLSFFLAQVAVNIALSPR